jgi:hypothetical protein
LVRGKALLQFIHQNTDWGPEPNAPCVEISRDGGDLVLSFGMGPTSFGEDGSWIGIASLRFRRVSRWCWDSTNDEGWYAGAGRYAGQAPRWGEFYEVIGDARLGENAVPGRIPNPKPVRHFLFYFRDETIECYAESWGLHCGQHRRSSIDR